MSGPALPCVIAQGTNNQCAPFTGIGNEVHTAKHSSYDVANCPCDARVLSCADDLYSRVEQALACSTIQLHECKEACRSIIWRRLHEHPQQNRFSLNHAQITC